MKDVQIEEVHDSKDNQYHADLLTHHLDRLPQVFDRSLGGKRVSDIPEIDQVETHDKQMVHGLRELDVPVKRVNEEDAAILVQSSRDPDCDPNADSEVHHVRCFDIHPLLLLLNVFKTKSGPVNAPSQFKI